MRNGGDAENFILLVLPPPFVFGDVYGDDILLLLLLVCECGVLFLLLFVRDLGETLGDILIGMEEGGGINSLSFLGVCGLVVVEEEVLLVGVDGLFAGCVDLGGDKMIVGTSLGVVDVCVGVCVSVGVCVEVDCVFVALFFAEPQKYAKKPLRLGAEASVVAYIIIYVRHARTQVRTHTGTHTCTQVRTHTCT